MSVLINGMEMPTSCMDCPFKGFDRARGRGNICTINDSITFHAVLDGVDVKFVRMGDCPLVYVPPHGRLIDSDAAIEDIRGEILEHQMNGMKGTPFYIEDLRTMWQRLEDEDLVPTVIEAEEGY